MMIVRSVLVCLPDRPPACLSVCLLVPVCLPLIEQPLHKCVPSCQLVQDIEHFLCLPGSNCESMSLPPCAGVWSWIVTRGAPAFKHCHALVRSEQQLIAVGASGNGKCFSVSVLDLADHAEGLLQWRDVATTDGPMSQRNWTWSSVMTDGLLIFLGARYAVRQKASGPNTFDWWGLDMSTWEWQHLPAGSGKRGAGSAAAATQASVHARWGHSLLFDAARPAVILIGGSSRPGAAADIRVTEAVHLQLVPSPTKQGGSGGAPMKPRAHGLPLAQQLRVDPCADLRPFCLSRLMSDVTVRVGSTSFPAHRVVLSAACPAFREMLRPTELASPGQPHTVRHQGCFLARPLSYPPPLPGLILLLCLFRCHALPLLSCFCCVTFRVTRGSLRNVLLALSVF